MTSLTREEIKKKLSQHQNITFSFHSDDGVHYTFIKKKNRIELSLNDQLECVFNGIDEVSFYLLRNY